MPRWCLEHRQYVCSLVLKQEQTMEGAGMQVLCVSAAPEEHFL